MTKCAFICNQKRNIIMASIYSKLDKSSNKRSYNSSYHNGKRIRKFLGCSRQSARALIKKFEYELLLNLDGSKTESKPISFEQSILSFKKDVERMGVKVKQISVIITKVNSFKTTERYANWVRKEELEEVGLGID